MPADTTAELAPSPNPAPNRLLGECVILLAEASLVFPAPGQRDVDMDRVLREIVPSLEQPHGQIVPGISYRSPLNPQHLLCVDGNHRLAGVRLIPGMKFKTIVLEHAPTSSELRRLRVAIAFKHNLIII